MSNTRTRRIHLATTTCAAGALALLAIAVSFGAAAYGDGGPVGPPIGNNKYRTTISEGGDEDDFTGTFVAGDTLDVTVTAMRGKKGAAPTLRPAFVLLDPDGLVVTDGVAGTPGGLGATLRGFRIDKSGPWAVRVSGLDGTAGDAAVSFRVKPAAKTVAKGQQVGGATQTTVHAFAACAGAVLDVNLVLAKGSGPVELRSLRDGLGFDVLDAKGLPLVDSAVTKGTRTRLRNVTLGGAAGTYELEVRAVSGEARYDLTLSVRSPKRPSSRATQKLSALEPALDPVTDPIVAAAGSTVRLTGVHFSKRPLPQVLFDGVGRTATAVGDDGTTLDVVVPPRAGPAVVSVGVVNADRQGTSRKNYLAYVPAPSCADLVDAWTGQPVREACATACRAVKVTGAHFEKGYRVVVGGVQATSPDYVSDTEIRFTLPVVPQGNYTVGVADPYGRSGSSEFTVFMKTPPSFAASAYSPGAVRVNTPTTVTISGAAFAATDEVWFAGAVVPSVFVSASKRTIDVPALAAGSYAVRIVDSVGAVSNGPSILVKAAPAIASVAVASGDVLGTATIPLRGGSVLQVDGAGFLASDVVRVGGAQVTSFSVATSTRKVFVAPAGAPGAADLTITDAAVQTATAAAAVEYAGLADVSSSRLPATSAADEFASVRGAIADLDGDGNADDVVLVAPLATATGSRAQRTRVLIGGGSGNFTDATASAIPAARTDPAGIDTWDASCLALGDLDGEDGPDILIAGEVAAGSPGAAQVRWFANDGSGRFVLAAQNPFPTRDAPSVTGSFYSYYYGTQSAQIFGATEQRGTPQAVATGDLDGDGAPDVVVGTDIYAERQVRADPATIDFGQSPPWIQTLTPVNYAQFLPAVRVYANRLGSGKGFADVSATSLPPAGDDQESSSPVPALHCRDLVLADLDQDGRLDLVVTWNDPATVSAAGLRARMSQGGGGDSARTATRILLNAGQGRLTNDVTDAWLPSPSAPEYWQADRVAAADLDGDGWPELVLVTKTGLDWYTGKETHTRSALRVLRNDHTHFTDVTSSAFPAVDKTTHDDRRGGALTIRDVDGDGILDLVVGTTDELTGQASAPAPRTRVLFGRPGLVFAEAPGFAERTTVDTGEAEDVLFLGDLAGDGRADLLLLTTKQPLKSPGAAPYARVEEWRR